MNKTGILIIVLVVAALAVMAWPKGFSEKAAVSDEFARCLTDLGVVMYGLDSCPHCQNEKKAFGNAFKYVTYVECRKEPKLCEKAGVEAVPLWVLPDGKRLVGEQGVEKLSQETGCAL